MNRADDHRVESPKHGDFGRQTEAMANCQWLFAFSFQMSKVKVHECGKHEKCTRCLGAKDPFCGWCSLENKCSVEGQCEDSGRAHWLPYRGTECTTIKEVIPDKIQVEQHETSGQGRQTKCKTSAALRVNFWLGQGSSGHFSAEQGR